MIDRYGNTIGWYIATAILTAIVIGAIYAAWLAN